MLSWARIHPSQQPQTTGEKLTTKSAATIPPIFLGVFSILLSLAWIIPNHTKPWMAFYSDAIAGVMLLIVAFWVLFRSSGKLGVIGLSLLFLFLAAVPWLQYSVGVVHSSGMAWINSIYLVGLSLAIFVGWNWERSTPGECLDFLFLAISIAAVISVGLQLLQWFQLPPGNFWVAYVGESRFSANMAQPNQLATLLLLSVMGVAWGYARKALGPAISVMLVLYLLFGVVLTESKTAGLNVAGVLLALYLFWGESRPKRFNLVLLGFGVYFVALYLSLPAINEFLFGEPSIRRAVGDAVRLDMWKSLVKAVMERPWLGYGWGQTTEAVFASTDFPATGGMTKHSHNIFLDIFLYNGLLLGSLVVLVLGTTFRQFLANLKQDYFIIPMLGVGLVLVHSMLELPLHYAYFLLPFGMILGVLGRRSGLASWCVCPKWLGLGFAVAVACSLWITVADCLEAERTYFNVYFGKKGIAIPPEFQPRVTVLTQWHDRLMFANSKPGAPLAPEQLSWMKGVIVTTPEPFLLFLLAQNLALNGQPDEAKEWLKKMCKTVPTAVSQDLSEQWESAAESNSVYRMVDWKRCPPNKSVAGNDLLPME